MATDWNEKAARWYVDGEPVHAGYGMQLQGQRERELADGTLIYEPAGWIDVRIESRDSGRILDAYTVIEGVTFVRAMVCGFDDGKPFVRWQLRWPLEGDR